MLNRLWWEYKHSYHHTHFTYDNNSKIQPISIKWSYQILIAIYIPNPYIILQHDFIVHILKQLFTTTDIANINISFTNITLLFFIHFAPVHS